MTDSELVTDSGDQSRIEARFLEWVGARKAGAARAGGIHCLATLHRMAHMPKLSRWRDMFFAGRRLPSSAQRTDVSCVSAPPRWPG